MNREAWLTAVADRVSPLYAQYQLKPYRVTMGWPCRNALGTRARRVGECHGLESSKGGVHEIFISPVLADPLEVAGTVCHEMAHVAAGIDAGHKGMFIRVCNYVGLTKGKPTQAMPGMALTRQLGQIIKDLGPYPHSAMSPKGKLKKVEVKDLTLRCPKCECKVRMSIKWLDRAGPPVCGCGATMLPAVLTDEGQ